MSGGRLVAAIALSVLAATGSAVAGMAGDAPGQWRPLLKVPGIVDVVGPRADGRLVVSTRGGLFFLRPGGAAQPFSTGPGGYVARGGEPYIALASGSGVSGVACSFERDDVYALDASSTPGVVRVLSNGQAVRFVNLPGGAFPSGIAFDRFGRFGYRLLVTAVFDNQTTLYAIDCLGRMIVITQGAPHVEGGVVIAPPSFGRFGGDLIAADEVSGRIFAFERGGSVEPVVDSGLPAGGDTGVEGLGFVPSRLGRAAAAYFSDLGAPGSPTQGNDSLLVLRSQNLARAGLRAGDLVAATEAGAATITLRCASVCTVRHVADGPSTTHGEGHITFVTRTHLGVTRRQPTRTAPISMLRR